MSGNGDHKRPERTLSRIGRRAIPIPPGIEVKLGYGEVIVKGPNGTLTQPVHPDVIVKVKDSSIVIERFSSRKFHRALHGLTRSLIANAITGASQGYQKTLDLMGAGYRVQQSGAGIVLNVGYSHTVEIEPLDGVTIAVEGTNRVHVTGSDKQKVGEVASRIRRVRPPNPYKEKGIKYSDEVLRIKPGKSAARKK